MSLSSVLLTSAQLTYHLDAQQNSYTLQTPNSQQTFTRYFGGSGNGAATAGASGALTAQTQQQQQVC